MGLIDIASLINKHLHMQTRESFKKLFPSQKDIPRFTGFSIRKSTFHSIVVKGFGQTRTSNSKLNLFQK
jgi:hypothetical protein